MKNLLKSNNEPTVRTMEYLAKRTNTEFDGAEGDNRLFAETITADTLSMTKKEYEAMEKDLRKYKVSGYGFTVSAWNDASGYKYWNGNEENNYIQVTAYIDETDVNVPELDAAIRKVINYFQKYALEY